MNHHWSEEIKTFAHWFVKTFYSENSVESLVACMDHSVPSIGVEESGYFDTGEAVIAYLQSNRKRFCGYRIRDGVYKVYPLGDKFYLVQGRYYVMPPECMLEETEMQQRISMVVRKDIGRYCCVSVHMSNPAQKKKSSNAPIEIHASYLNAQRDQEIADLRERLRRRENQLEVALNAVSGVMKCSRDDSTYSYTYVSEELAAMFGYTIDEFMEMSKGGAVGACYPPDLERTLSECEACFAGGNPTYAVKYRIRCKDGSLKWIMDSGRKEKDSNGECMIYSIYLDITKDQEAREEMWQQKQLLDSIYEMMMCGVVRYSVYKRRDLKSVRMNSMALEMLGYQSEAECLRLGLTSLNERVVTEDFPKILRGFDEMVEFGGSRMEEFRIRRPDGVIFWIYCQMALIERNDGLLTYQCVLIDVTEQKALQRKLDEAHMKELERERSKKQDYYNVISGMSKKYYAFHMVNLDDGYYLTLRAPEDTSWALKSGYAYDEDLMEIIELHFHPEDRARIYQHFSMSALRKQNERRDMEVSIDCRRLVRGGIRWGSFIATLVLQNDGDQQVILSLRDIHGEKIKELAEQQAVKEAFKAAQMANVTKNEFLSRMSHDIRTPMNAIIGMTAIMSAHLDDRNRLKDCLSKINTSSRHLLSLINEVLDMGKIESGKMQLEEEAFSIADMVQEILDILRPQIDEKQHDFSVTVEHSIRENVIGDRFRIRQVLINVLANAVKYTPVEGRVAMTIREKPLRISDVACYEFIIEDNGIGMTQEFVNKVFEPFARAEDSRISNVEGTGLGMAIALNIVRMMNGTIDVESQKGIGSKFTVSLCLKLQKNSFAPEMEQLKDLLVLIIHSERESCEDIGSMLREIGMVPVFASSGKEALQSIKQANMDERVFFAAIIDWKMPFLNGQKLTKAVRSLCKASIVVIAINDCICSEVEQQIKAAGVDLLLGRPLFQSKLVRALLHFTKYRFRKEAYKSIISMEDLYKLDYSKKHVLLVEDNELNMEIAMEILRGTKMRIETAANGKEALEVFTASPENTFDLIFMDIQMPIMNGLEATKAIRSLNRADGKSVPIVAMTANAFAEDIQRAKRAGMNEHMSKPIDLEELQRVIVKWL